MSVIVLFTPSLLRFSFLFFVKKGTKSLVLCGKFELYDGKYVCWKLLVELFEKSQNISHLSCDGRLQLLQSADG